jgi:hypothetical protein
MKLSAVINYSSHDHMFLNVCVEQAAKFCDEIFVVAMDRKWNGEEEDLSKFAKDFSNPKVCWATAHYNAVPVGVIPGNEQRALGAELALCKKSDDRFVLFLDLDEIIDTESFGQWWHCGGPGKFNGGGLTQYWYFRDSTNRARAIEANTIIARSTSFTPGLLRTPGLEREVLGRIMLFSGGAFSSDYSLPLIHHFSWIGPKERLLTKARCWSHRHQRDWVRLVEEEYSHPFNGKDFIHGYSYDKVEPPFKFEGCL